MDINFKNDALALVGIKSTDPEIVGTDSMDLNIEIPVRETALGLPLFFNPHFLSNPYI